MSVERRPHRIEVRRANRSYWLCGLARVTRRLAHPAPVARGLARRAGLLPGATLLLIVLFSAFVLNRPPMTAEGWSDGSTAPHVAPFTFSDFAAASR